MLFNAALLLLIQTAFAQLPDCGGKINIRYEWRDIPKAEQQKYLNAIVKLHKAGKYEQFAQMHNDNYGTWHENSLFFPVHRYFLSQYETALRDIDPTIIFPYWAWSLDAATPLKADIWKDFGTVVENGQCVTDGVFANWQLSFPVNHCLTRNSTGNTFSLDSTQSLYALIQNAKDYEDFRSTMENYPHMRVHVLIGGANGNGDMVYKFSPNDPIFFMHHGYIDALWNNYQLYNPKRLNEYAGDSNAALPGFSGIYINNLFDTKNLCFIYAQPGTNYTGPYFSASSNSNNSNIPPPGSNNSSNGTNGNGSSNNTVIPSSLQFNSSAINKLVSPLMHNFTDNNGNFNASRAFKDVPKIDKAIKNAEFHKNSDGGAPLQPIARSSYSSSSTVKVSIGLGMLSILVSLLF